MVKNYDTIKMRDMLQNIELLTRSQKKEGVLNIAKKTKKASTYYFVFSIFIVLLGIVTMPIIIGLAVFPIGVIMLVKSLKGKKASTMLVDFVSDLEPGANVWEAIEDYETKNLG